ncbi:MAG: LamG domain-containing protein [Bacteroidales bacterium]|nr:LamG domain-containing protein [Bacteroidales bacterium]MCF8458968.1 LamG domain-containing protein [Bacteroidales bacterium]
MKLKILLPVLLFVELTFGLQANAQNALDLDGIDDYVSTTFPGISGTSARTIEAYIKTTANCNPSAGGSQQVIVDWGQASPLGQRFTFNVLWSNAIRIEIGGEGLSGTIPVNDGNWHYVAVVYNPSASVKFRLYTDGVLDIAGNITQSMNTASGTSMLIGRRVDNVKFFDGTIDEVRVYNYAKTLGQINAAANIELCSQPTGLVAYFKLNNGIAGGTNTGVTTTTSSVGNYTGTLNSFALTGTSSNWVTGATLAGNTFSTMNISGCGSYTAPSGAVYTAAGTYQDIIPNAAGCDSVITINLTMNGFATGNLSPVVCGGGAYTSPAGNTYTTSGFYTDTIYNTVGCDSLIYIDLTFGTATSSTISVAECGATYTAPSGNILTSSGIYSDTIPNSMGCDSIIIINLSFEPATYDTINVSACDVYTSPSGLNYYQSGVYTVTIPNSVGCDSIITINLTVNNYIAYLVNVTECGSYVSPTGNIYTQSGLYSDTLTTVAGCDSVIVTNLTLIEETYVSTTVSECGSYTSPTGNVYTLSGVYVDTLSTVLGCDSIITLNLYIFEFYTDSIFAMECETYTSPTGNVYDQTGIYYDTIPGSGGCDSLLVIDLIITGASSSPLDVTECGYYTSPSGNIYTQTGVYFDTLVSVLGCDSILTINFTMTEFLSDTIYAVECETYISPNGNIFTQSGIYADTIPYTAGCDSLIVIDLSINDPSASFMAVSACETYTSPSGTVYTSTGIYTDVIPNSVGCDSIISIDLTINQSTTSNIVVSECYSYVSPAGNMYTASGVYVDTIPDVAGCDSIISIDLSINNTSSSIVATECVCPA